jgi:internalin A
MPDTLTRSQTRTRPTATPHDRRPLLLASACLVFLALGCGGGDDPTDPGDDNPGDPLAPLTLQPGDLCSANPDSAIGTFTDLNLESAVRRALLVGGQANLTCDLLSGVTEVAGRSTGVESLVGIQNLPSLTNLDLSFNSIADVGPLSGLTNLTDLNLFTNLVADISALSGLTGLTELRLADNLISDSGILVLSGLTALTLLDLRINSITDIGGLSELMSLTTLRLEANAITDVAALSGLTSLTSLWLFTNSIADIGALNGLTSLTELDLHANSITDIGSLSGLTNLTFLGLSNNPDLNDIQPLLDNTGLGVDDTVDLKSTNASCTDVATLETKGVSVSSDCP